jgi:hypothetical protein
MFTVGVPLRENVLVTWAVEVAASMSKILINNDKRLIEVLPMILDFR